MDVCCVGDGSSLGVEVGVVVALSSNVSLGPALLVSIWKRNLEL